MILDEREVQGRLHLRVTGLVKLQYPTKLRERKEHGELRLVSTKE